MSYRRISFLFVGALVLCLANLQSTAAQISRTEPENLTQGTKIVVTYNPKAENAKLSAGDEIYVSGMAAATDGEIKSFVGKMEKSGDLFKYEISLAPNLYSIQISFVTLRNWDDKAGITKKVNRPDGSPAKNASLKLGKDYLEAFNKEIALYPDNYHAYREKWFAGGFFDKEKIKDIVAEDMKKLADVKEVSAELLYAQMYGYLLLGQEPKAREAIQTLAARYPTSPFLQHALGDYMYQAFSQEIKGDGPDAIERLMDDLIQKYPQSGLARNNVGAYAAKASFPLAAIESICQKWMQEEPEHPEPPMVLATAYMVHKQKLDLAATLVEKSLSLYLRGFDRLYISSTGSAGGRLIPQAYHLAAGRYR